MSKRVYTTVLLSALLAASLILAITALPRFARDPVGVGISIGSLLPLLILLIAHLRGWRWTAEALVITLVVLVISTMTPGYQRQNVFITGLVPCVIAAALLTPLWSFIAFIVALGGGLLYVGIRGQSFSAEAFGPTVRVENLLLLSLIALGVMVASAIARHSQQLALESAARAQAERDQVELKSQELLRANDQMNDQIEQQRQLLDLVATLETPTVQLADGILFAPIVGHLDSRRAQAITARLLREVSARHARLVILDIGGVAMMDTGVAQALLNTAKSLKLLGCTVAISGISAVVAMTLTELGINLDEVITVRSPQEALALFAEDAKVDRQMMLV